MASPDINPLTPFQISRATETRALTPQHRQCALAIAAFSRSAALDFSARIGSEYHFRAPATANSSAARHAGAIGAQANRAPTALQKMVEKCATACSLEV